MFLTLQKGQLSNVLSTPFSLKNSSAFSSDDACFTSYATYYSEGGLF